MQNFLVCFYSENSTNISHQVLVRDSSQASVSQKAKAHFLGRGTPATDLASFTVEAYGEAKIDLVEVI
jgi:hypothetical protein